MLCTLLLPRLSFLTLVMASFALKLCCSVFSVRLDIVVVVCMAVSLESSLSEQDAQAKATREEKKHHLT